VTPWFRALNIRLLLDRENHGAAVTQRAGEEDGDHHSQQVSEAGLPRSFWAASPSSRRPAWSPVVMRKQPGQRLVLNLIKVFGLHLVTPEIARKSLKDCEKTWG